MKHFLNIIFVFLGLSVSEAVLEFKKNASEFMSVGFNKGRTGTRVTELAITVQYKDMFEGGEEVDIEALHLEVKAEDGCWKSVEEKPLRRGKDKQMWRVKVFPCKEHFVRLGLKKDGCVEYYQYPESVGPATAEEIANSHFRPSIPEDVAITPLTGESVVVSWSPSSCAESYELWYESHDGDDSGNMTVSAGFGSVTVRGLKDCTDYTMYVTAMVEEEFSEEVEAEFTTCKSNGTAATEIMTAKEIDDDTPTFCEPAEKECELVPTMRFGDIGKSDLVMLNETDAQNPEAQKSQAITSFRPILCTLVTQIALVLIVL